jgi:hypothetical protein
MALFGTIMLLISDGFSITCQGDWAVMTGESHLN